MAEDRFKIAIVGSGPGGMTAAAHASRKGLSHVLLEGEAHLSNTIYRYQKGKHVMAEPEVLPLHKECPLGFEAGTRENILQVWNDGVAASEANVAHSKEVKAIGGERGDFTIDLASGEQVKAEFVVLAIGTAGNPRRLGVPGSEHPRIQYQLDDPKEYEDETIVVVGAGDAAIENAIGLAAQNTVIIVNRRDEFNRAKQGNLDGITRAIDDGTIECMYSASAPRVEAPEGAEPPLVFVLDTPDGEAAVPCDRIIARLGGIPPRRFVESCGVKFPNDDPASVPAVSPQYESNVPGLYIIGALAGYPLIKQCMNQGYEVVEYIEGNPVEPADEPLLREKFKCLPDIPSVDAALTMIIDTVPLLSGLTPLQLREFLLDSTVIAPPPKQPVFKHNDYTNTFFSILHGEVHIQIDPDDPTQVITLGPGQFFGEMSLISGRRRNATVLAGKDCALIETPRRSMNKLINSVESVKRTIDEEFLRRAIQQNIAPDANAEDLAELARTATIEKFKSGEELFHEGDVGDSLHMIRVGSVTVSRQIGDHEVVLSYLPAGNYVGEMALVSDAPRSATVRAAVATETVRLEGSTFKTVMSRSEALRRQVEETFQERVERSVEMESQPESGNVISFLVQQGLGEATDVLLIDESLCVRCDYCEKACADTHGGTSRLDREAGPTFAQVHVPTSCRHCEHPHCMKECPPDAIHRAANGEVFIADNCIGCGNCQRNCPYGVIQMAQTQPWRSHLWSWLFLGAGNMPGENTGAKAGKGTGEKKAVKCDMCKDLPGGPACVRACPTGAALRVKPEEFLSLSR